MKKTLKDPLEIGGEIPTDSSGTLKYVRVQYAGYEVFPGNELNGITFGGVGSGTDVSYIQVHNNADDCVDLEEQLMSNTLFVLVLTMTI